MIPLKHLVQNPDLYKAELEKRFQPNKIEIVDLLVKLDTKRKETRFKLDKLRTESKNFNTQIIKISDPKEKQTKIAEMKQVSENIKTLEKEEKGLLTQIDNALRKIPTLSSKQTPKGKDDNDNPVTKSFGQKKEYSFEVKPYWELDFYKQTVGDKDGVKAMGARGYYLKGQMALFQRVLIGYAVEKVLAEGFELFYVPLMLNENVLKGTGHLPDFDGQQYEISLDENNSFYLIGSSEPAIMGYFMGKNLGKLDSPILATCHSSCFRKEAGSYGKDQQGILRVHQFEKVEMVSLGSKEQMLEYFEKFNQIVESIYNGLGLHYCQVEVCSGDIPAKHYRQVDYEAFFPSQNKFREICSSGNASDYQTRGLNIFYQESDQKLYPWSLNCTAVTFRTGLAILEQFQNPDGSVTLPKALAERMKVEKLG